MINSAVQCRSRWGRNMILQKSGNMNVVIKTNTDARADCHSVARRLASEEGGDCRSLPAAHQIGRWANPNISGNSWGDFSHHLRAFRNFPLQGERRSAPPFWDRLDCTHCTHKRFPSHEGVNWFHGFLREVILSTLPFRFLKGVSRISQRGLFWPHRFSWAEK